MSISLKTQAVKGILWSSIERFSVQGISFCIMIVMARLLTPDDYGLIGMLAIFIAVAQSLVDSGFPQALIRKQDRSETDNSTVFHFNFVISVFLYAILYVAAPFVADFYNQPILIPVMRVVSVVVVINSLAVVQRALLTVNIDFKTQAKASLTSALISGVVGITLAYCGYGVWSLVCYQLVATLVNVALLWVYSRWRPKKLFSWESFRELFSFGSKLLATGLINTIFNNLYPLIIGKFFSASSLGHYTRASQFSEFPSSNVTGVLQRVTYPLLCKLQDDDKRLAEIYRHFLKLSAFVIFPMMVGLAAVSKPFVLLVVGEQWLFAAQLLQIICFAMMWYPIHSINLNLLQVKGRSDLFLRLEIIKKTLAVVILLLSFPFGVIGLCYGQIVGNLISLIINTHYTSKFINVGFWMQMRDLFPTLLLCLSMFALILSVNHFVDSLLAQLLLGIVIGVIYYCSLSYLFRFSELDEIYSLIKK